MNFPTFDEYKEIDRLKKQIQAQVLKIAKDAVVLNSMDFQISCEIHGFVNGIDLYVFIGGSNENCSNRTTILQCYTQPLTYNSVDPEFWQKILNDLIAGQKKLRELKKNQIAEAKKAEAI
ncbi:hypothetical protein BRY75_02895 [Acinetobacter baumannii]|uniref:hypothetical protein n=1 Tax=Acinetobacter baumannii TaxID=470 RepID=UPI00092977D5|nr:hypothetical protein [Acinetobacter baumannii]OJK08873.1 hypothetical protein BRY75_02895 [Acinetobacter baumannii]